MRRIFFLIVAFLLAGCAARRPAYNDACGGFGLCKTVPLPHRAPPKVHR